MVMLLWAQVGFSMVLLSAAVKGVPVDTLEAARIDGANERQIFFRVVVPQIKGTIITVFVTVTIGVMKIFDIVYVMTNGNFNTNVIGNEFCNQLSTFFNNGAAVGDRRHADDRRDPDHDLPGAPLQGRGGRRMTDTVATPAVATPTSKTRRKAATLRPQPGQGRLGHQARPDGPLPRCGSSRPSAC